MIITKTHSLSSGKIRIRVGNTLPQLIGLQAIGFPVTEETIDIVCPQIDSTIYNRKRILRRILFGSINKNAKYGIKTIFQEFIHIVYKNIDSNDSFIDLKFIDKDGNLFKSDESVTLMLSLKNNI